MKATRRKFFGFMGGAAVAGPAAAKSLAAPIAGGGISGGMGFAGIAAATSSAKSASVDPIYVMKRISELRDRIAGKRTKRELESDRLERIAGRNQAVRHQIDSLRSVSMQHKSRMAQEVSDRLDFERQKYWWQNEIDNLLGLGDGD